MKNAIELPLNISQKSGLKVSIINFCPFLLLSKIKITNKKCNNYEYTEEPKFIITLKMTNFLLTQQEQ